MILLGDSGFHAAVSDPPNLKVCPRGTWNDRMTVETVLSMLTLVSHFKKVGHRVWAAFQARLAFTLAAFNVLVRQRRMVCSPMSTALFTFPSPSSASSRTSTNGY